MLVISAQHAGLVAALKQIVQNVGHQRCRVHVARNLRGLVPTPTRPPPEARSATRLDGSHLEPVRPGEPVDASTSAFRLTISGAILQSPVHLEAWLSGPPDSGVLAAVATVPRRAHAGAVNTHLTVRVATLGLLLVCLGGSLAPAQATSHHDRPVYVPTVQHGSCHMAGDGESLV